MIPTVTLALTEYQALVRERDALKAQVESEKRRFDFLFPRGEDMRAFMEQDIARRGHVITLESRRLSVNRIVSETEVLFSRHPVDSIMGCLRDVSAKFADEYARNMAGLIGTEVNALLRSARR